MADPCSDEVGLGAYLPDEAKRFRGRRHRRAASPPKLSGPNPPAVIDQTVTTTCCEDEGEGVRTAGSPQAGGPVTQASYLGTIPTNFACSKPDSPRTPSTARGDFTQPGEFLRRVRKTPDLRPHRAPRDSVTRRYNLSFSSALRLRVPAVRNMCDISDQRGVGRAGGPVRFDFKHGADSARGLLDKLASSASCLIMTPESPSCTAEWSGQRNVPARCCRAT